MPKNSLAYLVSWILFQLLVKVNCQMLRDRTRHTATFIDNKLYILGGRYSDFSIGKEFIYLDFSVKLNTKNLLWHNLTSMNTVPSHEAAASVKGGANNNTLFIFGGNNKTDRTMALVYIFRPQSNNWSTPTIASSININRKRALLGIIDYNGKMYLWGGFAPLPSTYASNDMLILDTINLSWGIGSLVGAPTARYNYGATLLPNQSIIYMGGYDGGALLSLNQVYIYDTINDNWSTKVTLGKIPSNRFGFSVILGLDGQRIIIFGGVSSDGTNPSSFAPEDSLYVLNLINFEWYIPQISGQIPSSRDHHKANVIGSFMVISFGRGYNQLTESDILLLDISNNEEYRWTNDFDFTSSLVPSATLTPSPSPTLVQSSNVPISILAGAIVGSLFGGILIAFGCFFLYKQNKNKQKQKNIILISGNENRDGMFSLTESSSHSPRQEKNLIPINDSYNYKQEISQTPRKESTTNHESIIPAPVIKSYNNERLSTQNIDDLKNDIIREVLQNLQHNNAQASTSQNV